jgi:hypothetical protein
MQSYLIVNSSTHGFSAHVTHDDGSVEVAHRFETRIAALEWVGERLIVRKDRPTANCIRAKAATRRPQRPPAAREPPGK